MLESPLILNNSKFSTRYDAKSAERYNMLTNFTNGKSISSLAIGKLTVISRNSNCTIMQYISFDFHTLDD